MSQKTFLSPPEQWDRTVAYWAEHHWDEPETSEWAWFTESYNNWLLGVITKSTRLFNAGDLVVTSKSNGADRYNVYAVSSKGYRIKYMYLPFDSTNEPLLNLRAAITPYVNAPHNHRTLYIPGSPDNLTNLSPYDPDIRKYISTLHDGDTAK